MSVLEIQDRSGALNEKQTSKLHSLLPMKQSSGISQKNEKEQVVRMMDKKGKVIQRNYVMNNVGALKKKLKHEARKQDFIIANLIVQMKASSFDFTKAKFIHEIQQNPDIVEIENTEAAKAATEVSGDAFVEYVMDISFSQIMIQPKGEQSGLKQHLGLRGTPRFFAETFLIPWCNKAVETKAFDDKISVVYADAIREAIRKFDINKVDLKKSLKNAISTGGIIEVKCVSKGCSFQGINPNNKTVVCVCDKCSNFEHFACVKIKPEHKEDILKGSMKYFCSECFSKNPSIGSSITQITRPRLNSIPVMGQGYLFNVTPSTTATVIPELSTKTQPCMEQSRAKELTVSYKCDDCNLDMDNSEQLKNHNEDKHMIKCTHCNTIVKTQTEMDKHYKTNHSVLCDFCELKFTSNDEIDIHIKSFH